MEKLREKFGASEALRETIKRDVARVAEIVQPKIVQAVIQEDPDDDHILAAARAGKVDIVVSGDEDIYF